MTPPACLAPSETTPPTCLTVPTGSLTACLAAWAVTPPRCLTVPTECVTPWAMTPPACWVVFEATPAACSTVWVTVFTGFGMTAGAVIFGRDGFFGCQAMGGGFLSDGRVG